jgi:ubiquinone/menaquinone biosynthesis C-methylase UbiE
MKRILDLGCGTGNSWRGWGLDVEDCQIVGLDISFGRLQQANTTYGSRGWCYACARGEELPLRDNSVGGAFCSVALPYMRIPRVLAELHRVLKSGGFFWASLHPPSFTWSNLRQCFPKPKQSLFRLFVFLNGMIFHLAGVVMSQSGVSESCQTERGMRIALKRAGFTGVTCSRIGGRFLLHARRTGADAAAESTDLAKAS